MGDEGDSKTLDNIVEEDFFSYLVLQCVLHLDSIVVPGNKQSVDVVIFIINSQ